MAGNRCNVYIDESGDLGINRGTDWFILTALIVDDQEEPAIRSTIRNIRVKLNLNEIHFRKLKHFEQKAYVVKELSAHDFTLINVIIDTRMLTMTRGTTRHGDSPSLVTYNFAARLLIERVSWLLRDSGMRGNIILSARGTDRDAGLIDYIKNKLIPYSENQIAQVFDNVTAKAAASWDLLQMADVCATSMYYLYHINQFDLRIPYFARRLGSHLYRHNNQWRNYGIKYYSTEMDPGDDYFRENIL